MSSTIKQESFRVESDTMGEINVPEDCAGRIAEKAMKDQAYATNPKVASLAEMKDMVLQSIKKAR